jgi:DNA mismatch repair protein MutS
LRHPLIEIQKTHIELITHDIALGCAGAGAGANHGLLLYGINASGKSSLMKAVGIAVVLAQLGFGVPALSMTLRPYKKIASRILNQDNLWAGLSSFAVEMVELRELLTAADAHTLVLGDELCAGTESVSATAIVGASINALLEARSSFILATHLHDLNKVAAVTDAAGLQIAHLKVHYDVARDLLVYDRTLAPGPGSANYGLTVAKALHLPPSVLETAYTYRRLLTGDTHQTVDTTNTSYNASVIRKSCAACGSAITRDLEVHHIQEQACANAGTNAAKTNADGTALHGLRNLVVVCRTCHDAHHAGKLHIGPVRQTSAGPERIIERTSASTSPKPTTTIGDLGEDDITNIAQIAKEHPTLSTKLLLFQIKERHGLDVTSTQIATLRRKKII